MSNRELARQMQRSESYVRARVNNEKEWTLNDIEAICHLWHMAPSQLVVPVPELSEQSPSSVAPAPSRAELAATAAREQAKLEDARHHIASGMGMAALHDEHKYDPEPDNNA